MRVLSITDGLPYPAVSGGQLRVYNLLRRVAKHHEVWLASLAEDGDNSASIAHLRQFCQGIVTARVCRRHPLAHVPGLLAYGVAGYPLELKFQHSDDLVRKIQDLTSTVDFDILEIEQQHMALYREALPSDTKLGTILSFLDIASVQHNRISQIERQPSRKLRAWLHSLMMRRWEPRYAQRFDRCITMSEADRCLLLAKNPLLSAEVIPNGVDTVAYQRLPLSNGNPVLLFVGRMNYVPCADAMLYFHEQILPIIRQKIPNVELWIVGQNPPHEVRQLEGDHVHVTGRVDDVLPYYEQASVCVVPLRAGSGTRLKILEAMALGRPTVSTSIGAEGLDVIHGQHLMLADGPEQFAATTLCLLEDRDLQERLARNARQLVTSRYDWDIAAKQLMRVYEEVSG